MRLLIVSYAFPPAGGAGVQRVSKLVKYLPDFGVTPTVLTAKNPSVPARDETLLQDIPEHVEIVRTRTLEPSYETKAKVWQDASKPSFVRRAVARLAGQLFFPDPQLLWLPSAAPEIRRLSAQVDVALISAPPFSPFLLGPLSRVPFVLDYRDEWRTTATYEMNGSALKNTVIDQLEPALVRRAAMIVTATEEFRQNLIRRNPLLDPTRVVTITNGYDPDDCASMMNEPPPPRFAPGQKLVMTYAGTTFRLTSPRTFLAALRILQERDPEILSRLDVRFVGRIVPTEERLFDEEPLPCVQRLGYVPHEQALRLLVQSHLALLFLDEVPGVESIYPAKVFEIMHLRRPILALTPRGAISRLIERHNLGTVVNPRDPSAIAEAITRHVRAFERGETFGPTTPRDIERFHRRAIAGRFAEVLRHVVETDRAKSRESVRPARA